MLETLLTVKHFYKAYRIPSGSGDGECFKISFFENPEATQQSQEKELKQITEVGRFENFK